MNKRPTKASFFHLFRRHAVPGDVFNSIIRPNEPVDHWNILRQWIRPIHPGEWLAKVLAERTSQIAKIHVENSLRQAGLELIGLDE